MKGAAQSFPIPATARTGKRRVKSPITVRPRVGTRKLDLAFHHGLLGAEPQDIVLTGCPYSYREPTMPANEYAYLLRQARIVLDRYIWDGETIRDDVAEVCMKIDDVLLDSEVAAPSELEGNIEQAAA
jgi:hypothetical protein